MPSRILAIVIFALSALAFVFPADAQGTGFSVTCDNGAQFDNGVEVIVTQMRAGYTYTATAIGLNGFDPVLAVLNPDGLGLCDDDNTAAANYTVNLPTTGNVPASRLSSQVRFSHNDPSGFRDISLVVGGFGNATGEFVLVLEGMGVTREDNGGDPFAVRVTPGMVSSGVPLTTYMIARTTQLDPLIYQIDDRYNPMAASDGGYIGCDDAGDTSRCWGWSTNLSSSFVTTGNGRLPGGNLDAMLSIPMEGFQLNPNPDLNFINLLMTSYQQSTLGQYVMAFHIGLGTGEGVAQSGNTLPVQQATPVPQQPDNTNIGLPPGYSVTCDNGAQFDNGVEVIVTQMRAGYTYTATAIGLNGFDPVLAVLDSTGVGLCDDDNTVAARYSASLPTTGNVPASRLSSQVRFSHNDPSGFADMSLVVGGFGNTSGEFILILEGMGVTREDNGGDPFAVRITPSMISSGVPLTAYMFARTNELDPLIARIDADFNTVVDNDGNPVACDDAGDASLCWGKSTNLSGSFVTTEGGRLGGFDYDAMLSLPLTDLQLNRNPDLNFINLLMTSYQQSSFGQYVLVLHMGTGASFTPDA